VNERFQLDLLVGRRVYDAEGQKLGRVDEILLVREDDRYAVEGLLMGMNSLAERLGVTRPLERLERRLNLRLWRAEDHIIFWEQIDHIGSESIRLKVQRAEVQTFPVDDRQ
jgi:sporulation protein YlmC with PRC-barrel domain